MFILLGWWVENKVFFGQFLKDNIKRFTQGSVSPGWLGKFWLMSSGYVDGLVCRPLKMRSWCVRPIVVLLRTSTLLVRWLLCRTNYVDVPSISGTIFNCILIFVPILKFFIRLCSVLVALFVDFDYTIFDEFMPFSLMSL